MNKMRSFAAVYNCGIIYFNDTIYSIFIEKYMNCPFCNTTDTKVIDSRETDDGKITRRRRVCEKCKLRFSTYEEVALLNLSVIKKDGTSVPYDKAKISQGLIKALIKRPVSEEKISTLLSSIEYEIRSLEKSSITTKEIGKIILKNLKKVDQVAYVRFASVFKSFGSIDSFKKELDNLDKE